LAWNDKVTGGDIVLSLAKNNQQIKICFNGINAQSGCGVIIQELESTGLI